MLDFNKHTTVQEIINDGEYNQEVKDHVKEEIQFDVPVLLKVVQEWKAELEEMGEKEILSQFDGLDEEEEIRWLDLNELLDYYDNQGLLADFVGNLDIDWQGLRESFGIE